MINKLLIALEQNDKGGYCVNILDATSWIRSSSDLKLLVKAGFVKGKIVNTPDATVELYDDFKDILTVEDFDVDVDVDEDLA